LSRSRRKLSSSDFIPRSGSNESKAPSAEERDHAVLPLREALLLLQGQHLLAHLRFPQLDQLVAGDDVFLLQQLLDRQQTGLVDEDGPLVLLDRVDDAAQALRRPLDDLFETGNALEQVLVEGEVALFLVVLDLVLFEGRDAREDHELVLTAKAILAVVFVEGTTGLTKHGLKWSL
jgi:hypothetical protein